jgi:hypothetical protein
VTVFVDGNAGSADTADNRASKSKKVTIKR